MSELQPRPWLAQQVLLVITSLDAEASGYLRQMAGLAAARGARLRLAYSANRSSALANPLARLKQRARHLGRLLGSPVETVDVEIRTLEALRRQLLGCAVVCLAKPRPAGRPRSCDRDLLSALIGLRTHPVLLVEPGPKQPHGSTLVPVALGPGSAQLLRWARAMAPDSAIELLHVSTSPAPRQAAAPASVLEQALLASRTALEHRLQALSAELGARGTVPEPWLLHGEVAAVIERRQRQAGHDLVVVGISARRRWLPWPRAALAQQLARRLRGDLLVVPQPPAPAIECFNWPASL